MKTYEDSEELSHSDTEITLGVQSILGIFFGLVLICGVFFGFGYSLGRGNSRAVAPAPASAIAPQAASSSAVKAVIEGSTDADSSSIDRVGAPKPSGAILQPAPPVASNTATSPSVSTSASNAAQFEKPATAVPASNPTASTPAVATMVQIAAVTRSEDANALVAALRNLGYSASVRSDSKDNLLHVQVGPFPTRGEANAIRAKLQNDGYNAILK